MVQQLVNHFDARSPKAWSQVQRVGLTESTEGGEAVYYYQRGRPQKITVQYLGEAGQQRAAFYLLESGQLVFVREQTYAYNRPITYDSAAMRENHDNQVFDLANSTISTTRSYFDHGRLVYQAGAVPPDSASMTAYQLREQRRLYAELHQLLAHTAAQ